MLHAKTGVIDSIWSTVGSTNLEMMSFVNNDEVNAIIVGEEFAQAMEGLFWADVEKSRAITPEKWRSRPITSRFWEIVARLLSSLL